MEYLETLKAVSKKLEEQYGSADFDPRSLGKLIALIKQFMEDALGLKVRATKYVQSRGQRPKISALIAYEGKCRYAPLEALFYQQLSGHRYNNDHLNSAGNAAKALSKDSSQSLPGYQT